MPSKTISQLTAATTISDADVFAIDQSGSTKKVAASVVRGGLVNANISNSAAIAYSKLAALNSAQILVGNGSNVPTAVSVTGDVTISNAGVTAIAAGAVVTADVADAAITPAKLSQPYTLATAQASTSGTSIDFTGIPSWARRITVMFRGVSTTPNNSNDKIIRIGTSAGIVSSGYTSTSMGIQSAATGSVSSTEGFRVAAGGFADEMSGHLLLTNVSGNVWLCSGTAKTNTGYMIIAAGDVSLSGALDRVRITTVNGTDTFDAGSINISYEG